MEGRPAAAQAPTPPISEEVEAEVKNCLDEIIGLVMKKHYCRELVEARRKKKRKESKEKKKLKKG